MCKYYSTSLARLSGGPPAGFKVTGEMLMLQLGLKSLTEIIDMAEQFN